MRKHLLQKLLLLAFVWLVGTTAWAQISISTAAELANSIASNPSGSYVLANDITYSGSTYMVSTTFTGTLDGDGHTITYNVTANDASFALFNELNGATIKDLNLTGSITTVTQKVAGLALRASGNTKLDNIKNSVNITVTNISTDYAASGYFIDNDGNLSLNNCVYNGKMNIITKSNRQANCSGFISFVNKDATFSFNDCAFSGIIRLEYVEDDNNYDCGPYFAGGFVYQVYPAGKRTCSFTNCAVTGSIKEDNQASRVGAFVGNPIPGGTYNNESYDAKTDVTFSFNNCLMAGTVQHWKDNVTDGEGTHSVKEYIYPQTTGCEDKRGLIFGGYTYDLSSFIDVKNCYFTSETKVDKTSIDGFVLVSDEVKTSGELCYKLNGNQSNIHFYQNLGTDNLPLLNSDHNQVYAKKCVENIYGYQNGSEEIHGSHNFVHKGCIRCKELEVVDGWFTADDQDCWNTAAARFRDKKQLDVKVRLNCDITQNYVICGYDENSYYNGTFDGQGHTITLNIGSEDCKDDSWGTGRVSMFGGIKNATIQNCIFEGTITGTTNSAPIATYANGSTNTFNNIVSKVYVKQTAEDEQNCSNMIAVAISNVNFNNCLVAGTVDAKRWAGGFVGWAGGKTISMTNCIMIGDVKIAEKSHYGAVFLRIADSGCTISLTNCYYKPCSAQILVGTYGESYQSSVKTTQVTEEADITSGKLCYDVNSKSSTPNPFGQNLGESNKDAHPYPFNYNNEHPQVLYVGKYEYSTFFDNTNNWEFQGATANKVVVDGNDVKLTPISDVRAGTAVVLNGTYYNKLACASPNGEVSDNLLRGSATALTAQQMKEDNPGCDKFYALSVKNGDPKSIGFYWMVQGGGAFNSAAGKAYLPLSRNVQSINAFLFISDNEEETAIESVMEQPTTSAIYNLQGQRVSANAKGIVIKNGKKYFVK